MNRLTTSDEHHKVGKHVYKNGDSYINLTTRYALPVSSSMDELQRNLFLEGQERDAIEDGLMLHKSRHVPYIHFDIIATWRCNLRCDHCFVLHKLKKQGDNYVDPAKLLAFIRKYKSAHEELKKISIVFIGGEATLNPTLCIDTIDYLRKETLLDFYFDMTSNGYYLDKTVLNLYSKLDKFMISLDGIESTHNNQRISLDGNNNPYTTTLNNIKRLVQYGLRDKLKVQASLPLSIISDDGIMARQFYKDMLMAGVKLENIHFGFTSPTRKNPKVSHNFRERMSKVEFHRPCCKYRLDTHYIIDDGGLVYADYFEDVSETYLGTLNDEISTIETNHVNLIKRTIPVLNDDKCIKCPVVGMCWGWCAASHNHFVKPSEYCSQELLHESIKASAEAGTLSKRLFGDKGPFTPGQTPTAF